MKLEVPLATLRAVVDDAAKALPSKPLTPAAGAMLVQVAGTGRKAHLRAVAFNDSMAVRASAPVDAGVEPCKFVLAGRVFANLLQLLPPLTEGAPSTVTIEVVGTQALVVCGSVRMTMPTVPFAAFSGRGVFTAPTVAEGAQVLRLQRAVLAEAVHQIAPFAATDPGPQPVLINVLVESLAGKVALVATDRYRLAFRDITAPDAPEGVKALIDAREFSATMSLLRGEEITITVGATRVALSDGATEAVLRMGAGEYPAYRNFSGPADDIGHVITFDRVAMTNALRLVAVAGTPVVEFMFRRGQATLSSDPQQEGPSLTQLVEVSADSLPVTPLLFTLDNIMGALSAATSPRVTLSLQSVSGRMATLRPAVENPSLTVIILPRRNVTAPVEDDAPAPAQAVREREAVPA